jgi:hypothetical protein
MLELESGWDESELGFTKFTRFLRQAHDAEIIDLQRTSEGYYLARIPGEGPRPSSRDRDASRRQDRSRKERSKRERRSEPRAEERKAEPAAEEEPETEEKRPEPEPPEPITTEAERAEEPAEAPAPDASEVEEETSVETTAPSPPEAEARPEKTAPTYGRRARRGRSSDGPPPLLPGQVVGGTAATPGEAEAEAAAPEPEPSYGEDREDGQEAPAEQQAVEAEQPPQEAEAAPQEEPAEEAPPAPTFDPEELGLPTEEGAVIRYLSNSYQGVGQKTAEVLIETFGASRVFNGLNSQPDRVREVLGSGRRTDILLDAWARDYRRRTSAGNGEKQPVA